MLILYKFIIHLIGELYITELQLPEDSEDSSVEVSPVLLLLLLGQESHLVKVWVVVIPLVGGRRVVGVEVDAVLET